MKELREQHHVEVMIPNFSLKQLNNSTEQRITEKLVLAEN
jgi:hypothetical protein